MDAELVNRGDNFINIRKINTFLTFSKKFMSTIVGKKFQKKWSTLALIKLNFNAEIGNHLFIEGITTNLTQTWFLRSGPRRKLKTFSSFTMNMGPSGIWLKHFCLAGIYWWNLRTQNNIKNRFFSTLKNLIRKLLKKFTDAPK